MHELQHQFKKSWNAVQNRDENSTQWFVNLMNSYFIPNIKNISNVETEIFYNFMGNISSFWLWWQQHISEKLEQGYLYQCGASPLPLATFYEHLGSEETSVWSFRRGMSHFFLIQDCSWSTVLGLCSQVFRFMIHQMFSVGERSGLQVGQFSTLTLFSHEAMLLWWMQDVV